MGQMTAPHLWGYIDIYIYTSLNDAEEGKKAYPDICTNWKNSTFLAILLKYNKNS